MKTNNSLFSLIRFLRRLQREDGSATVEFILLALPLFIPLSIYLVSITNSSTLHNEARNLARQTVRAYVSASSQDDSLLRVAQVKDTFLGQNQILSALSGDLTINFSCSADPCLTPGALVSSRVHIPRVGSTAAFDVSADEYVDQWINQ